MYWNLLVLKILTYLRPLSPESTNSSVQDFLSPSTNSLIHSLLLFLIHMLILVWSGSKSLRAQNGRNIAAARTPACRGKDRGDDDDGDDADASVDVYAGVVINAGAGADIDADDDAGADSEADS